MRSNRRKQQRLYSGLMDQRIVAVKNEADCQGGVRHLKIHGLVSGMNLTKRLRYFTIGDRRAGLRHKHNRNIKQSVISSIILGRL